MNAEMDAVSGEVTEGEWSDAAVTVADCPELVCDARREDYYTQFTGGTVVADCVEEDGTKKTGPEVSEAAQLVAESG